MSDTQLQPNQDVIISKGVAFGTNKLIARDRCDVKLNGRSSVYPDQAVVAILVVLRHPWRDNFDPPSDEIGRTQRGVAGNRLRSCADQ
jgi:hypothetical protein